MRAGVFDTEEHGYAAGILNDLFDRAEQECRNSLRARKKHIHTDMPKDGALGTLKELRKLRASINDTAPTWEYLRTVVLLAETFPPPRTVTRQQKHRQHDHRVKFNATVRPEANKERASRKREKEAQVLKAVKNVLAGFPNAKWTAKTMLRHLRREDIAKVQFPKGTPYPADATMLAKIKIALADIRAAKRKPG